MYALNFLCSVSNWFLVYAQTDPGFEKGYYRLVKISVGSLRDNSTISYRVRILGNGFFKEFVLKPLREVVMKIPAGEYTVEVVRVANGIESALYRRRLVIGPKESPRKPLLVVYLGTPFKKVPVLQSSPVTLSRDSLNELYLFRKVLGTEGESSIRRILVLCRGKSYRFDRPIKWLRFLWFYFRFRNFRTGWF